METNSQFTWKTDPSMNQNNPANKRASGQTLTSKPRMLLRALHRKCFRQWHPLAVVSGALRTKGRDQEMRGLSLRLWNRHMHPIGCYLLARGRSHLIVLTWMETSLILTVTIFGSLMAIVAILRDWRIMGEMRRKRWNWQLRWSDGPLSLQCRLCRIVVIVPLQELSHIFWPEYSSRASDQLP
jgi:hypothetical protein